MFSSLAVASLLVAGASGKAVRLDAPLDAPRSHGRRWRRQLLPRHQGRWIGAHFAKYMVATAFLPFVPSLCLLTRQPSAILVCLDALGGWQLQTDSRLGALWLLLDVCVLRLGALWLLLAVCVCCVLRPTGWRWFHHRRHHDAQLLLGV